MLSDSLGLTVNVSGRRVARRVPLQQIVVVLGTIVLAERSVCICQTTKKTQTDAAWYVRVHSVSNENISEHCRAHKNVTYAVSIVLTDVSFSSSVNKNKLKEDTHGGGRTSRTMHSLRMLSLRGREALL